MIDVFFFMVLGIGLRAISIGDAITAIAAIPFLGLAMWLGQFNDRVPFIEELKALALIGTFLFSIPKAIEVFQMTGFRWVAIFPAMLAALLYRMGESQWY